MDTWAAICDPHLPLLVSFSNIISNSPYKMYRRENLVLCSPCLLFLIASLPFSLFLISALLSMFLIRTHVASAWLIRPEVQYNHFVTLSFPTSLPGSELFNISPTLSLSLCHNHASTDLHGMYHSLSPNVLLTPLPPPGLAWRNYVTLCLETFLSPLWHYPYNMACITHGV